MASLRLIPSESSALPEGCQWVGRSATLDQRLQHLHPWAPGSNPPNLLVLLAATRTAEHPGISAAGATPASRRFTALADAELLLEGPSGKRRWPLPPLPAGVSPALLSYVALRHLKLELQIAPIGLEHPAPFSHLCLEASDRGPAACVSTGRAMPQDRVEQLWRRGMELGAGLRGPLLLTECVPGGTTTAQAVLTALGVPAGDLISGSARQPPQQLKRDLVAMGLQRAALPERPSALAVLAAVGDPFQAVAAGLLTTAREPVLLGGGSQMAAVMALALSALTLSERQHLAGRMLLATTAWLAEERFRPDEPPALGSLLDSVSARFGVPLVGVSSGVHFHATDVPELRDYERGFVKEGVGAGALLFLAQLKGAARQDLVDGCERAVACLQASP